MFSEVSRKTSTMEVAIAVAPPTPPPSSTNITSYVSWWLPAPAKGVWYGTKSMLIVGLKVNQAFQVFAMVSRTVGA